MDFMLQIRDSQITNKRTVRNQFDALEDGTYLVSIKSKKNRSLSQNKYWWSVVVPLVKMGLNNAGYQLRNNDDAHEVLKALFLKKYLENEGGPALEIAGSTSELNTIEFTELIERVQQWGIEFLDMEIPSPNEKLVLFN